MAGSAGAGSGSVGGTPSAPDTGLTSGIGMGLQLGLIDAQNGGKSFAQVELAADFVFELQEIQICYKK